MAGPTAGDGMDAVVKLLTTTIAKQEVLQAMNKNVEGLATRIEGLATRIEGIEATILRIAQSGLPLATNASTEIHRDHAPIAGPSLLRPNESIALTEADKEFSTCADSDAPVSEHASGVSGTLAAAGTTSDAHTPRCKAHSGFAEAAPTDLTRKGKQREWGPEDIQPSVLPTSTSAQVYDIPTETHIDNPSPPDVALHVNGFVPDGPTKLPTSINQRTTSNHLSSLGDDDMAIAKDSRPKRKPKLRNPPCDTPLPSVSRTGFTVNPTISRVDLSAVPTSAVTAASPEDEPSNSDTGTKRKPEDLPTSSPSKKPRLGPRKRQRVEVVISWDAETRARLRPAAPYINPTVREVNAEREAHDEGPVEAAPHNTDAFGSGGLSDLTDLESDDDDDGSHSKGEVIDNDVRMNVDPDGEVGDKSKRELPKRKCVPDLSYAERFRFGEFEGDVGYMPPQARDSDSDYKPSTSTHHSAIPGPSSRPHTTRTQSAVQKPTSVAGTSKRGPPGPPSITSSANPRPTSNAANPPPVTRTSQGATISRKAGLSNPQKLTIVISPQRRLPASGDKKSDSASGAPVSRHAHPKGGPRSEPRPGPPLRMRQDIRKDKVELELVLPAGIRRRLKGLKSHEVKLDSEIRDVVVPRKFMSETCGGNVQALFPAIAQSKRAALGGHKHHLVYPTLKRNPEAPQMPGQPGLLCRALTTVPWEDAGIPKLKLVVGIGESMWGYMGDYTTEAAEPLSAMEWDGLPEQTKRTWATDIAAADKYIPLRSRIILHERLGREPTDGEVNDEAAVIKAGLGSRKERPKPTKDEIQQIIRAYSSGKQLIYIWRFKCVGYDEAFQRDLVSKFSAWRRRLTSSDQPAGGPQPPSVKRGGRAPVRRKDSNEGIQGSSATASGTGPRKGAKKPSKPQTPARSRAPPTGAAASIPSPPITPSPTSEAPNAQEKQPGWLLGELREQFSRNRETRILDSELAHSLHERKPGICEMKAQGRIDLGEFHLLREFVRAHGYAWANDG